MNGTRCVVTTSFPNLVEVTINTGLYSGETHTIPRIILQQSDTVLPFTFQRRQFPLRPCYAMTINKIQGQTSKIVGLDLRRQVFSHGMMYVALSRTGSENSTIILAPGGTSRNIVYIRKFYNMSTHYNINDVLYIYVHIANTDSYQLLHCYPLQK